MKTQKKKFTLPMGSTVLLIKDDGTRCPLIRVIKTNKGRSIEVESKTEALVFFKNLYKEHFSGYDYIEIPDSEKIIKEIDTKINPKDYRPKDFKIWAEEITANINSL